MLVLPTWLLQLLGPAGPFLQTLIAGLLSKTFIVQTVARVGALLASLVFKDRFERMKEQGEMLMFSHMRKDDLMGNSTLMNYNLKKAATEERLNEYVRDYEVCNKLLNFVEKQDLAPLSNFSNGMIRRLVERRNKMAKDIQQMAKDVVELEKSFEIHQLEMDEATDRFKELRNNKIKFLEPICKWGWVLTLVTLSAFLIYVTYQSVASLQPGTLFYDHFGLVNSQGLALYQNYYGHEIISCILSFILFWFLILPQIKKTSDSFNFMAYRAYVLGKLTLFISPGIIAIIALGQSMDILFAEGSFLREVLLLYVPVAGEFIANLLITTWFQAILQLCIGGFLIVFMFKKYDFGPRHVLESEEEKALLERHKDHQNDMIKSHASMRFAYRVLLSDIRVSLDEVRKASAQSESTLDEDKIVKIEVLSLEFNSLMEDLIKMRSQPMRDFGTRLLDEIVERVESTTHTMNHQKNRP
jgi:hypothetical protein